VEPGWDADDGPRANLTSWSMDMIRPSTVVGSVGWRVGERSPPMVRTEPPSQRKIDGNEMRGKAKSGLGGRWASGWTNKGLGKDV